MTQERMSKEKFVCEQWNLQTLPVKLILKAKTYAMYLTQSNVSREAKKINSLNEQKVPELSAFIGSKGGGNPQST